MFKVFDKSQGHIESPIGPLIDYLRPEVFICKKYPKMPFLSNSEFHQRC